MLSVIYTREINIVCTKSILTTTLTSPYDWPWYVIISNNRVEMCDFVVAVVFVPL